MNCPICSISIDESDFLRTYIFPYHNQEYKLYHCLRCDLKFWYPLKIFPEFYEKEMIGGYFEMHVGIRKAPVWQNIFLKNFLNKKGNLLDVGCGSGVFLKGVKKFGFNVYGIDFDNKSVKVAREEFSLKNVYNIDLKTFTESRKKDSLKFDIITFFEVLEHQDDPIVFIREIKKLLRTGGYIAGSVPDSKRPFVERERNLNTGDFPPHHFLWFSENALRFLFEKEGFTDIKFYPVRFNLWYYAAFLEATLLGEFGKRVKVGLKRFFIKPKNEKEIILCVDTLQKLNRNKKSILVLQFLRLIRNIIFLPLAMLLFPLLIKRGYQIYFQAKFKN